MRVVVKLGGRVLDSIEEIAGELASLASDGVKAIVVHGGGGIVDSYSRRMGVEPRYVVSPQGIRSRYTSREELEVYVMVMRGLVSARIVSSLQRAGLRALGVSGLDLGSVVAERKERIVVVNERGRLQVIPGGYTGRIVKVEESSIRGLLRLADVLVVSPIASGPGYVPLNVDGDQMAAEIAAALGCRLVMVTDVEGVIIGGSIVRGLSAAEALRLAGSVGEGMNRKLVMAARAVQKGAPRAIIGSPPIRDLYESRRGTVIHG